jgi:anti-sigma factor RsiW
VTLTPSIASGSARRYTLHGFAMGGIISTAIAACLVLFVVQKQEDQRIVGDAISAHLRAVQGQYLVDVVSTDEQAMKPWFNGRLDRAPPVIDLRSQGCTLVGGRIDYVNGAPVAAIVYQRGDHVINLFVSQAVKSGGGGTVERVEGLSIWRWAQSDLGFVAVSDVSGEELQEFGHQFAAAVEAGAS